VTHLERIAHAKAHSTCFACANYCGQFSRLSAHCIAGGLDPEWTAKARDPQAADIRSTVTWANSCPRFVAAAPMQMAADRQKAAA
jgi:hypothetical protein